MKNSYSLVLLRIKGSERKLEQILTQKFLSTLGMIGKEGILLIPLLYISLVNNLGNTALLVTQVLSYTHVMKNSHFQFFMYDF